MHADPFPRKESLVIDPIVLLQALRAGPLLAAASQRGVRTAWHAVAARWAVRTNQPDTEAGSAPPACPP